ncbi:MAG: murein transglycosylase A [Sphingomonas sp.]
MPPAPDALPVQPAGERAIALGVRAGPPVSALGLQPDEARAALAAFRLSCPGLVRRIDASGLTRGEDWRPACAAAAGWPDREAAGFFVRYLETVVVGDGRAFATGYYEPEIAGSRDRRAGYDVPVYRRPPDLIEADLGLFAPDLKGRKVRGQAKDGRLVLYPDRAAIEDGALSGRGLELAWAADPIEFFFLQVQGSGRLRLPDGGIMRIGYDSQNGREYVGIGGLMKGRGLLGPGQSSMQGIMAWLRANPVEGRAIMNQNKSFFFFRELTGAGPRGAMGVAVTGRTRVAADPAFVPLGAPVFVALDRPEATGLWVAQDTGGAIKGANRFDTFWGAGAEARTIAGGMSGRGQAWLLLPAGAVARLNGAGSGGTPARP